MFEVSRGLGVSRLVLLAISIIGVASGSEIKSGAPKHLTNAVSAHYLSIAGKYKRSFGNMGFVSFDRLLSSVP